MASANKTAIAFDLYGTLLSTESIAKELATHLDDDKAKTIAATWRRYQLEYTWRLNSMSIYKDFSHVTEASLKHALAESSVSLDNAEIESLMHAYDSLAIFPDVKPALESLKSQSSIDAYIFTNGANAMVSASVNQSPSLSPFAAVFKALVTVDDIKVFKPDPRCYYHLADSLGVGRSKEALQRIWLVSSNPFDVVGARAAGMRAAWVDRVGLGWVDGLGELAAGGPTVVVKGVDEALREIERLAKEGE